MDGMDSPTGSDTNRSEDSLPLSELQAKIKLAELELEKEKMEREYVDRERARAFEREKMEREERLQKEKWEREERKSTNFTENEITVAGVEKKAKEAVKIFVQPIKDNSDPETIFSVFERTARIQKIDTENYMEYIQPALTERSLKIFSRLSEVQARDYLVVKEAILNAFHLTPEDHLIKFRSAKMRPDESYSQFLERISEHFSSWIKGENAQDDIEKLKDLVVREQYVKYFPAELKIYLADRDASDLHQIAKLADKYESVRKNNRPNLEETRYVRDGVKKTVGNLRNVEYYSRKPGIRRELPLSERPPWRSKVREEQVKEEWGKRPKDEVTCYRCHKRGHISTACPDRIIGGKTERRTEPKEVYFVALTNQTIPEMYARQIIINGKRRTAYRDTGAEISLVRPDLVLENQWTGTSINIVTATGETRAVPTARVKWLTNGRETMVEVAVIKALPFDCIIANDLGEALQATLEETEQRPQGEYGKKIYWTVENPYEQKMRIQDRYISVKRDTGSQISIVNSNLVGPRDYIKGMYKEIRLLDGTVKALQLAKVKIDRGMGEEIITPAACPGAPFGLLLANDFGYKMRPLNTLLVLTRNASKREAAQKSGNTEIVKKEVAPVDSQLPTTSTQINDVASDEPSCATPTDEVIRDPGDAEMSAVFGKLASVTNQEEFITEQANDQTLDKIRLELWPSNERDVSTQPIMGENLSEAQRNDLNEIFNRFSDVLKDSPGLTHLETHDIELTEKTPICKKQYRNPWAVRHEINKQVKDMLQMNIIEPSRSKYASPVILVPKKDGSSRFVVDFRTINQATKFDAYPNSNLTEALTGLGRSKYLTKIDLVRGYWQIPLTERAREITAFRTEEGLFHFKVMPFGLKNSSATFVRLMDRVLHGLSAHTRYYVDDLLIFSEEWDDHLRHIETVMNRLRDAGLTAKPNKCSFGVNRVEYLGFQIGPDGISPNEAKIKAIMDWPRPSTKRQVRAFLGVTGYYRQHIPRYADIALPLIELTKKAQPNQITWSENCEVAFKALKGCLSRSPVLASPDFSKEFILQTDASDRGLGAVLCQLDEENRERPIAYLSRKLNNAEQSYSPVEKEALAIIWGVQRARPYLYGKHFKIISDHNPLVWMQNFKGKNRKILRWVLQLQEYDFEILYKKGRENVNADGLSRQM